MLAALAPSVRATEKPGGVIGIEAPIDWSALNQDVSFSSTGEPFGAGGNANCAMIVDLKELTGGSSPGVSFTIQTSSNGVHWYDTTSLTACTAACTRTDLTNKQYMQFVRFKWTTTGTPDTAVADAFVECQP